MAGHKLVEIGWPDFGAEETPPQITLAEYEARLRKTRELMARRKYTHLVVYGDREHFANIQYLTGFDPRFEEALFIVPLDAKPFLVVGNECEGYLGVNPLWSAGKISHARYSTFSLLSQPGRGERKLKEILASGGIGKKSRVGCAGWKYFDDSEMPDAAHALEIPSFIAGALCLLAGDKNVFNAADLFMHPQYGMRSNVSAAEIAYFEYSNIRASEAMKKMLFALVDGVTDYDLVKKAEYAGEPLNCHITLVSEKNKNTGLSGPVGARIRRGSPFASNIGYWGSNTCRAGWVASGPKDLPSRARDYVRNFAGPYFEALAGWFGMLRIGVEGGRIHKYIMDTLPPKKFGIFLNPGHLIHMDEWTSSPIYKSSRVKIASGMVMQSDVIPSSRVYFSTRMEDGYAVADSALRAKLKKQFPKCFRRIAARRKFMERTLGIPLPEEVLPLSNICGIAPPYMLRPEVVITAR